MNKLFNGIFGARKKRKQVAVAVATANAERIEALMIMGPMVNAALIVQQLSVMGSDVTSDDYTDVDYIVISEEALLALRMLKQSQESRVKNQVMENAAMKQPIFPSTKTNLFHVY